MRANPWVVVLSIVGASSASAAEEKKPVVAVFEIQAQNLVVKPNVLSSLGSYIATKLAETGRYEVVPQDKIKEALTENKKKTYKDCYSQSCQIAIGQEVAANRALSTKVMKLGSRCTVTSDLFDLRKATSGISAAAKGDCSEDGIQSSIDEVVAKLARTGDAPPPVKPVAKPDPSPAKPVKPDPLAVKPIAKPDPPPAPREPTGVVRDGSQLRLASQIHFEFLRATILPRSFPLLDEIARVLVANPQLRRLRVEGHTDNKGKARELLKLSQARAEAVRAQLIRRGVEPSRLEAVGRGMTMPIAPNMTANGRATNRRVEIVVVEGGGQGTAPTPALPTDARSHFLRAQKAYTEGRYADAILAFRAASKLDPRPALDFNIARCHEQLGQIAEAVAAYRRFLARTPAGPVTNEVLERIRQLEARQRTP